MLVLDYSLKRNSRRYLLYLNVFSILLLHVSGSCCTVARLLPELFLGLGSSVSRVLYIGLDSVKVRACISLRKIEYFFKLLIVVGVCVVFFILPLPLLVLATVFLWRVFKKNGPGRGGGKKGFDVCEQVSMYQLKFCEKRWQWTRRKISCEYQGRFQHSVWGVNEIGYVVWRQGSSSY